jgi:hypothetical protein
MAKAMKPSNNRRRLDGMAKTSRQKLGFTALDQGQKTQRRQCGVSAKISDLWVPVGR